MGSVIGEILPLALGIAISPIPIMAAILMLLSPKAKATSVGFMLGWICGIVVALIVFVVLASVLPQSESDEPQLLGGFPSNRRAPGIPPRLAGAQQRNRDGRPIARHRCQRHRERNRQPVADARQQS